MPLPSCSQSLLEGQALLLGASDSWPPSPPRAPHPATPWIAEEELSCSATPPRPGCQWALCDQQGCWGPPRPPSWAQVRPGHTVPTVWGASCPRPDPVASGGLPGMPLPAWGVLWTGRVVWGDRACAGRPQEPPSRGSAEVAWASAGWVWVAGGQSLHLPGLWGRGSLQGHAARGDQTSWGARDLGESLLFALPRAEQKDTVSDLSGRAAAPLSGDL